LFTPTAAVFVEVGKSRTLRDSKLAANATAYSDAGRLDYFSGNPGIVTNARVTTLADEIAVS
jgi:hypothetical protein